MCQNFSPVLSCIIWRKVTAIYRECTVGWILSCWKINTIPINIWGRDKNCHHFADDIFKCIFLNEDVWISVKISLKFVPKVRIIYIPAWVQIMAWRRPGDKPLSGPVMVSLLTHMCITRPQWVKCLVATIPVRKGQREVIFIQTDRYSWDCHWDAGPYVNTSWCFVWVPLHDFKWESYIDI